ncbi:MAG: hypothetical protein UHS54_06860 [Lachnospiraceae bacterium]|nr:hypothetical protein [Lachnospiraceae bacterium]
MNTLKKKKMIRPLAFLLIFIIFFSSIALGMRKNRVEPDNPLLTEADELKVDISQTGGAQEADQEESGQQSEEEQEEQEKPEETPPEEPPENEPEEADEGKTDEAQPPEAETDNRNTGEKGNNSSDEDNSQDTPSDGGNENQNDPGPGEGNENEPGLVTDLYSRIITYSELENNTLNFYVYYSDPTVDANIKVNYRHKNDSGSGTYLSSSNDKDYSVSLSLGQNYITVYFTNGDGARTFTRYVITYQADKANENTPEIGEHPPIIETTLDDWSGSVNTSEFTFVVSAKTWQNERIYSDHIVVAMDGTIITNPTGSGVYEYLLTFERPLDGDTSNHVVTVLAWDDEGNSRYVKYQVQYHAHDEGESLGYVTVIIDATTVQCGIVESMDVEVRSGDTAATAVLAALDENGYSYTNLGTAQANFYLSSISKADAFRGCSIEPRLRTLIERDGIGFMSNGTRDRLAEFDFTRGSGWLYFINGSLCPGKSMSGWTLNGGETISLRFTLAYGKDLGLTQEGKGALTSYCAAWVNGGITELGHNYTETSRVEPTGAADGYIEYTCTKCGETRLDVIPATGTPTPTPTETPGETPVPEETPAPEETPVPEETPTPEATPNPEETPVPANETEIPVQTAALSTGVIRKQEEEMSV